MDTKRKFELIDKQILDANDGAPANFDDWHNNTEVVVRRIFGEDSPTAKKFNSIQYSPAMWTEGTDFRPYRAAGVRQAISILSAAKLELKLEDILPGAASGMDDTDHAAPGDNSRGVGVFVVHGRDDARKFEATAFIQNLTGSQPIILHQQANGGRAIIEKLETHAANVGFAVILLTGDDHGRPKELSPDDDQPRARQNVIFEMGLFFGLLGRNKVAVLFERGVELPSDIHGIVYIELDAAGGWKPKLAVEIEHAGLSVDWSALGRS